MNSSSSRSFRGKIDSASCSGLGSMWTSFIRTVICVSEDEVPRSGT